MSALVSTRVGWCPGALKPMATGDGLIVRIKPRSGTLSPAQACGIAEAARAFGNGDLDLTTRANLQIRGASARSLPGLMRVLRQLDLLDPDPAGEAVRNVVSSPLAGFDAAAVLDIRPFVAALDARLASDRALQALPAKFSFVVDDGGRLGLADVPADIRFEACRVAGEPAFAVRLGGGEDVAGLCPESEMVEVATILIRLFLEARAKDADIRRMRHLVARIGAEAILRSSGLKPLSRPRSGPTTIDHVVGIQNRPLPSPLLGEGAASGPPDAPDEGPTALAGPSPEPLIPLRGPPQQPSLAGAPTPLIPLRGPLQQASLAGASGPLRPVGHLLPQGEKGNAAAESTTFLGVAVAFGRLTAAQLETLATAAREAGATDLRLTPWRAILAPGLEPEAAARMATACAAAGLIVDPGDPRLRVAACPGAPGCHRGTTPVLDHAARIATLLPRGEPGEGILLHVSGCSKGCAHAGKAPVTLVGHNGAYDMVRDGTPADSPVLEGLAFEDAARAVTFRGAREWPS